MNNTEMNTSLGSDGSSRGGSEVSEVTPENVQLTIVLPSGNTTNATVQYHKQMLDVLITVATANNLAPSQYTFEVDGVGGRPLDYKPSQSVGSLGVTTLHLVQKTSELRKDREIRQQKPQSLAFERTRRLTVNLPRGQRSVLRVNYQSSLAHIFNHICTEKNLDPYKYELRHPTQPDQDLNMATALDTYGLSEISVVRVEPDSTSPSVKSSTSSNKSFYAPTMDKKKKKGLFSIFSRSKKEEYRKSYPSAKSFNNQAQELNDVEMSSAMEAPPKPPRNKRSAPPPPATPGEIPRPRMYSDSVASSFGSKTIASGQSGGLRPSKKRPAPPPPNNVVPFTAVGADLHSLNDTQSERPKPVFIAPPPPAYPPPDQRMEEASNMSVPEGSVGVIIGEETMTRQPSKTAADTKTQESIDVNTLDGDIDISKYYEEALTLGSAALDNTGGSISPPSISPRSPVCPSSPTPQPLTESLDSGLGTMRRARHNNTDRFSVDSLDIDVDNRDTDELVLDSSEVTYVSPHEEMIQAPQPPKTIEPLYSEPVKEAQGDQLITKHSSEKQVTTKSSGSTKPSFLQPKATTKSTNEDLTNLLSYVDSAKQKTTSLYIGLDNDVVNGPPLSNISKDHVQAFGMAQRAKPVVSKPTETPNMAFTVTTREMTSQRDQPMGLTLDQPSDRAIGLTPYRPVTSLRDAYRRSEAADGIQLSPQKRVFKALGPKPYSKTRQHSEPSVTDVQAALSLKDQSSGGSNKQLDQDLTLWGNQLQKNQVVLDEQKDDGLCHLRSAKLVQDVHNRRHTSPHHKSPDRRHTVDSADIRKALQGDTRVPSEHEWLEAPQISVEDINSARSKLKTMQDKQPVSLRFNADGSQLVLPKSVSKVQASTLNYTPPMIKVQSGPEPKPSEQSPTYTLLNAMGQRGTESRIKSEPSPTYILPRTAENGPDSKVKPVVTQKTTGLKPELKSAPMDSSRSTKVNTKLPKLLPVTTTKATSAVSPVTSTSGTLVHKSSTLNALPDTFEHSLSPVNSTQGTVWQNNTSVTITPLVIKPSTGKVAESSSKNKPATGSKPISLYTAIKQSTTGVHGSQSFSPVPSVPLAVPYTGVGKSSSGVQPVTSGMTFGNPQRVASKQGLQPILDPSEELMIAIRNFGGRSHLRKVPASETKRLQQPK